MNWDGTWKEGTVLAMWQDGPGHLITDTGMQLLTRCGRRVTYLGARVDTSRWFQVDRPGCFECQPSPMAEWAQQQSDEQPATVDTMYLDAQHFVLTTESGRPLEARASAVPIGRPFAGLPSSARPGEKPTT